MRYLNSVIKGASLYLLLIVCLIQCQSENDLDELTTLMSGSFSSQEQAENDSNFYDIRLEMVPIWEDRTDGKWLYVEQAAAWSLDKPYRQRVYNLIAGSDGIIHSVVYSIPNPLRFAGAWQNENPLSQLSPDSLQIREGCVVILKKTALHEYTGSTRNDDCQSTLRGASYATTAVSIYKDKIISWDRGFAKNGEQVWGSTQGGYIFKRIQK
jgi:hypothetical protein